ncbi:hypothetical protein Glove_756g23 [Diversispora epigaea]|uniref:Uncharacterized protein n=1 Tax=Diversispora epigaea TaxID=1348612 RepID=A0A397G5I0_9GLOM|nr:hypothetical protein Glove_756g23 [Diversispora epigaea]
MYSFLVYRETVKIKYCPAGHPSEDYSNFIRGRCALCTKAKDLKLCLYEKLQRISYDDFKEIEHMANGSHGFVYSAKLEKG